MSVPSMLSGSDLADMLRTEIAAAITQGIGEQLTEMRRFIDRRFAELSAEVDASATMAEMTEASLAEQINRVQAEMARMVTSPIADTRSSGVELEAVVQGTEDAANQILECAEVVLEWIEKGADPVHRSTMAAHMQTIFEACSFQDITSQRIRRAIHHLQEVDNMLGHIASPKPGATIETPRPPPGPGGTGADLDQDMIDRMMG